MINPLISYDLAEQLRRELIGKAQVRAVVRQARASRRREMVNVARASVASLLFTKLA